MQLIGWVRPRFLIRATSQSSRRFPVLLARRQYSGQIARLSMEPTAAEVLLSHWQLPREVSIAIGMK